jgi:hypothetical protein
MVAVYGTLFPFFIIPFPSQESLSAYLTFTFPSPGLGNSSAVGPEMVGQLASTFLDALYKA